MPAHFILLARYGLQDVSLSIYTAIVILTHKCKWRNKLVPSCSHTHTHTHTHSCNRLALAITHPFLKYLYAWHAYRRTNTRIHPFAKTCLFACNQITETHAHTRMYTRTHKHAGGDATQHLHGWHAHTHTQAHTHTHIHTHMHTRTHTQVADAMLYLHGQQPMLIHRDLKLEVGCSLLLYFYLLLLNVHYSLLFC